MGAFDSMIGAKSKPSVKEGRQKDQGSVALRGNISFPMTKEFVPTQHFGRIRLVQNTGAVGPSQASVEQHYLCEVLPVKHKKETDVAPKALSGRVGIEIG